MTTPSFSRPGAVDLSVLGQPAAAAGSGASSSGAYVVDVTEVTFNAEVIESSLQHVVVLVLWSPRSPGSVQVADMFTRLSDAYEGRFSLARADVDVLPQIAEAVGAQDVPFLVALLGGQPIAQIPPVTDEGEAKAILDQLIQAALTNGVTGRAQPRPAQQSPPEPVDVVDAADPRFAAADAALAADDLPGAVAAYRALVAANPADREAAERLAGVELMSRAHGVDPAAARREAAERPDDVSAQTLVADLDVLGGHVDDAFARLVDTVARTSGDERERVRAHLLSLFDVVGTDDPAVATARRRLAAALF